MNQLFGNIAFLVRAAVLVVFQVLLFNNLTLFDISRPFPYVLAILYLPIRMPRWQGLLLAFVLGYVVDIFNYSYGIHAAASVFMYFIRDFYLHTILSVTEESAGEEPHLSTLGSSTFLLYVAGMVFIHHLAIVSLDILSISRILIIVVNGMVNTVFSLLLIMIIEIIFFYQRGQRK